MVHGTHQFVDIDQREEADERAEDVPEPEVCCAEGVRNLAAAEFVADAVAEAVGPHQGHDATRQPTPKEEDPEVVGGLAAIVAGCYRIDFT